jgi:hypothetical protein
MWKQDGITTVGGHGQGNELNQLFHPCGVYLGLTKSSKIIKKKYKDKKKVQVLFY